MDKESIERLILEGPSHAVAISVDTCIFERHGFRFGQGMLRHLEQFKIEPATLLISDVVRSEVLAHLTKKTSSAGDALRGALRDVQTYWTLDDGGRSQIEQRALGAIAPCEVAKTSLETFLARTGSMVVVADEHVQIDAIMRRYFDVAPPFEASGTKKSEFPDAVALMSLEAWSRTNRKPILVVSNDKGWQAFAQASDRLCCVDTLEEALAIYQRRDSERAALIANIAASIGAAPWSGLDELRDLLDRVRWQESASTIGDYEIELEVIVESVAFAGDTAAGALQPIDFTDGTLTVAADLVAQITANADFVFSLDDVSLGGASPTVRRPLPFQALLTFSEPATLAPQLEEAELVRQDMTIDFGEVMPDYSDEDPSHERY